MKTNLNWNFKQCDKKLTFSETHAIPKPRKTMPGNHALSWSQSLCRKKINVPTPELRYSIKPPTEEMDFAVKSPPLARTPPPPPPTGFTLIGALGSQLVQFINGTVGAPGDEYNKSPWREGVVGRRVLSLSNLGLPSLPGTYYTRHQAPRARVHF